MKNRVLSILLNLKKHFWAYLLAISLSVVFSIYYVDLINTPRKEETITLFIGCYETNVSALGNKLKEVAPDCIREISIKSFTVTDPMFDTYYASIGIEFADVIILPASKTSDSIVRTYYSLFSNEIKNEYFFGKEFYKSNEDNKEYGVLVHKNGAIDDKEIIYDIPNSPSEDYYAFIRKNSLHAGKINGSKVDTALRFLQVI